MFFQVANVVLSCLYEVQYSFKYVEYDFLGSIFR